MTGCLDLGPCADRAYRGRGGNPLRGTRGHDGPIWQDASIAALRRSLFTGPTILAARQQVLHAAYAAHPQRFVNKRPTPLKLPNAVWINPPPTSSHNHEKGLPKTVGSQKPDAPSAHPRSGYPSPSCVPAEPGSVSPDTLMLPDSVLPQHLPSDTRAMPQKIPGVWGNAVKDFRSTKLGFSNK